MLQRFASFVIRVCRSVDALRRFLLLLALTALATSARAAAEGARRLYAVAGGDAATTLPQFVEQSGEQVVYLVPKVRGVKTNPVRGEFTAREVLDRMLANTALVAVQDEKSGALMIHRPAATPPPAAPPSPPRPPQPQNEVMKRKNPLALVGAWFALALAPLHAQPPAGTGVIEGHVQNRATGEYLNNARVAVQGTERIAFTDKFGVYHLVNVPAGRATLEVFYTGLDLAQVPVTVPAQGTVTQDVALTSVARYGAGEETLTLDAFVVSSDRETDAQAIATNEQRFAPNLKNVMSTDSLGDVLGGSVGEFMKFLPGVTAEYDLADVAGVSVRGISGAMTSITNDGAPASNIWVSTTRSVDVRSMALNDISRIEVTKVPTPANPADSLAGNVNMVSKSAFERSRRQLRWGLNLVGNSENLTLRKTPHSHRDRLTHKVLPGANLDFTWPLSKTFGLVIAATHAEVFNEQHRLLPTWSFSGSGTNAAAASPKNPFLSSLQLLDGPRDLTRNSLSVKADWKVAPNAVLSVGHIINRTDTRIGSLTYTWSTGTNGTPTPATGTPMTFGSNYTLGATGRGSLTNDGTNQLINQMTDTSTVSFRYDDGRWRLESGVSHSASEIWRRYNDAGFFFDAVGVNRDPVRVSFLDISGVRPGRIEVFDNNGQPYDYHDIANYRGTTARNADLLNRGYINNGFLNLRRRLEFLPVPASLQLGGSQRDQMLDTSAKTEAWTFMGPDGASPNAPLAPYTMRVYRNVDPGYGFFNLPWLSPTRALEAWKANPLLYQKTEAQRVTEFTSSIQTSERIDERIQALYAQAEADLFHHRLHVLGGVRFEHTDDRGQGSLNQPDAVWQRHPDGSYVRNAAGQRVRKPEAGAAGSLQEAQLTWRRRAAFSHRTYQGYYPSLHLTFNATENFLVRAAYARTYGRPNFSDIIPRTVATAADIDPDDPTPATGRGNLTVRNPSLRPWTANNYDLSVEYYTPSGGLFTAGVFRKDLQNFFGSASRIATPEIVDELGLDRSYVGWNVSTSFNSGDARITGAELNVKQSLRALGRWGGYFTLFANGTKLQLDGAPGAAFTSFIPRSGNGGFTFARQRLTFTARWNYRGLDKRAPQAAFNPNGYEYIAPRTVLDVNGSWQLSQRLSLVASANNVFNVPMRFLRYGDDTPSYARRYAEQEYGIALALGLRGSF
jgi:TonB-dependent receptor